ncbi:MAG: DUF2971 domain-containing protein [Vicinamibacterales bacterium]
MTTKMTLHEAQEFAQGALARYSAASAKALTEAARDGAPPETLYHFTEVEALAPILTSKALWSSLATSSMDPTELSYAIRLLTRGLQEGTLTATAYTTDWLLCAIENRNAASEHLMEGRSYLTSFCGAPEGSHWLHYGRSGTGVAIAFSTELLNQEFSKHGADLVQVIYDPARQHALVERFLRMTDEHWAALLGIIPPDGIPEPVDRMRWVLFDMLRTTLTFLNMKHPAFQSEEEWRFGRMEMIFDGAHAAPPMPTFYRTSAGRLVPYKQMPFSKEAVTGIILGASCPMRVNEPALAQLMSDALGRQVPVTRSSVEVRP